VDTFAAAIMKATLREFAADEDAGINIDVGCFFDVALPILPSVQFSMLIAY
jgi:hypothetical protein